MNSKRSILFTLICGYALFCSGQVSNPCEKTKIGTLIIKPLMEKDKVNYAKAFYEINNNQSNAVSIIRNDSLQQTLFSRVYLFTRDSMLILACTHVDEMDECFYHIIISGKKSPIMKCSINSDGKLVNNDLDSGLSTSSIDSNLIEELLKYFN